MTARRRMGDSVAQSPRLWLVWAENRTINADAYVERLRMEAKQARSLAGELGCDGCEVAIVVPRDGERYAFHRAYVVHELGCDRA